MANLNAPRGLIPYRGYSGNVFNGPGNIYYVPSGDSNNIFVGDPVIVVDDSADANGIPAVTLAAAGGGTYITGAMVGLVPGGNPQLPIVQNQPIYRQASVATYILVSDDPDQLYEIQEDSVGGAMVAGAASRNADLVLGAGSTATGYSGWMLDSSTLQTSNTLQLRILQALQQTDNSIGNFAKWLVKLNLSTVRNLTGV